MKQITNNILMIRPEHFGFNEETAANNSFQTNDQSLSPKQIEEKAKEEFDAFVNELKRHNVHVIVMKDTDSPIKPDALFPNNWVSFHEDGSLVCYPMFSETRRKERRHEDLLALLGEEYKISRDYTFEHYEEEDMFLEGTGSMILDRVNNIVYANLSARTDLRLLDKWCILMNYKKVVFFAKDRNGEDIYHTNVMMALGTDFCVICLDSITNENERIEVEQSLQDTGKEIIKISYDQMEQFAGNMLQVGRENGSHYLVMSKTAHDALTEDQLRKISAHTSIIVGNIPTIEKYGGGSVRCMMAEMFLPLN